MTAQLLAPGGAAVVRHGAAVKAARPRCAPLRAQHCPLRCSPRLSRQAAAFSSRAVHVTQTMAAASLSPQAAPSAAGHQPEKCLLTTSITATTLPLALEELREAEAAGADAVELRLDFLATFEPTVDLPALLSGTRLPAIVTFRASWEGGKYAGPEPARFRALWHAVELGAAFVDIELKAAAAFFNAAPAGWTRSAGSASSTRFIVSSHNYAETPSLEALRALHTQAAAAGADIVKIATTATSLLDVARLEALLEQTRGVQTVALGMGEAGLVRQLPAETYLVLGMADLLLRCSLRVLLATRVAHRFRVCWRQSSAPFSRLAPSELARSLLLGSRPCSSSVRRIACSLRRGLRQIVHLSLPAAARLIRRMRLHAGNVHARAGRHRQAHFAQPEPCAAQRRTEKPEGGRCLRAAAGGRLARVFGHGVL